MVLLFLAFATAASGQGGNAIWYFGYNAGVDFNTDPPTALFDGQVFANEGCGSLTDGQGNLLMYSDGEKIFNRLHQQMPNGFGLTGGLSSSQTAIFIPQPGNDSIIFIFTPGAGGGPFCYSAINKNLDNGLGDVTTKNVLLLDTVSEQISAVHHANGIDFWVTVRTIPGNTFYTFLVTASGVNPTPVLSTAGPHMTLQGQNHIIGQLKFSPDGIHLASAMPYGLMLFCDFDASTGILSNDTTFMGGGYGVEFSPSGQYLYNGGLLQWDVSLPTITDVIASRVQLDTSQLIPYYSLQLANNGKIYCTSTGNFGQLDYHLGVINYPDNPGAAADFDPNGINLSPRISLYGLPSSVQSFNYTNIFISSQFFCSGSPTQFSIQTRGPGKLQNYLWDFGDPGSVNNTSSDSLPAHIYSAPGQYMVTLVGTIGTTVRRKTYVVNILPSPQVNVSPPSLQNICAGESINLQATAQQNLNYQWYSNGVLLPDDTLSNLQAATSGFYQVIVSDSVCSGASDSVEIIVHPQADAQITPQNPAPICTGQTITLSAGQSTGNNYTWLINRQLIPDAALPVYNAASAGNYQAIVSSNGFCADTSEITIVLENPAPVVTIQKDLPDKCTDATVLTATGADSYVWSTGASGATLSVLPAEAGIYSVTGQNPGGCTGSATAIVFSAECEKEISAPNVITPNNDGQNDFFEVADTNLEFDLQVFNRWGKVIFERKNYQKQQDWRADEVPDGLYFYLISITNGQRLKGWIEVIR